MNEKQASKSETKNPPIGVLKTLWTKNPDGRWGINGIKGVDLKPKPEFDNRFFQFQDEVGLLSQMPPTNIHDAFSAIGSTDFFLRQSILPVIAYVVGEQFVRCIGTAFVISCSGYVMTACHVIIDPQERGYGKPINGSNGIKIFDKIQMGVLMPLSPAYGGKQTMFVPFVESSYWGQWEQSPLHSVPERFNMLSDIAICKLAPLPSGAAYQPLNLSLFPFAKAESAYAIGYANMQDTVPVQTINGQITISPFQHELCVSVGEVIDTFPENHLRQEVFTPGPCFDFNAKIPGKMSGGPILGGKGSVVRGVVSSSYQDEAYAYGALLSPMMSAPLINGQTLKSMMDSGLEGMTIIKGRDL